MAEQVQVTVNGRSWDTAVESRITLADFLRERCGLTGTHLGCEHGVCGACTVLLDGEAVRACLVFAVQADGAEVTTVEGLTGPDGELSPVQAAFREHHGLQCGFCTPGMVMTALAMVERNKDKELTETLIRHQLEGNLCRCTGYQGIVKSIAAGAAAMGAKVAKGIA